MGGKYVEPGDAILNAAGIPTFSFPDTAARAFVYMWRYSYHLRGLYETPSIADDPSVAKERTTKAEQHPRFRLNSRTLSAHRGGIERNPGAL